MIPKKKVIAYREPKKNIPRILPPMERPVTPCGDGRSLQSARSNRIQNLPPSSFEDGFDSGVSSLETVRDFFLSAKTAQEFSDAIITFEEITITMDENQQFNHSDIAAYHQLYPILQQLVDTSTSENLIRIVNGLRHILNAFLNSKPSKPIEPTITTPKPQKNARMKKLKPLTPLDQPAEKDEKEATAEHFNQFISKVLYKLSGDKINDQLFDQENMVNDLIAMTSPMHKVDTRTYSVATLKNEAHSPDFRQKLINSPSFREIFLIFENGINKYKLLIQCAGLMRNLIIDMSNIPVLIENNLHLHLFNVLMKYSDNPDVVYNCFRVLTKMSDNDEVRETLIDKFSAEQIIVLLIQLLQKHNDQHQILTRVAYVFADFAAYEPSILEVGGALSEPVDIALITDMLSVKDIREDKEVSAMLLQVIANLSVDEKCASLLTLSESIPQMFECCTFAENDRVGLNLLCTSSNFTFHDHSWAPNELINCIPRVLLSKNLTCIIEALRILCNLALKSNQMIVDSKIPELLGIMLKHPNPDVVLYSLQTLANLVNHAGVRRRFRSSDCINTLIELFKGDEVDEMELEAIAALVMNFGAISSEEAQEFLDALDEFDLDESLEIIPIFITFLKQQLLVDQEA